MPKLEPFLCIVCSKWFIKGTRSCLVVHAKGTCCHYGDTPVDPPTLDEKLDRIMVSWSPW